MIKLSLPTVTLPLPNHCVFIPVVLLLAKQKSLWLISLFKELGFLFVLDVFIIFLTIFCFLLFSSLVPSLYCLVFTPLAFLLFNVS